VYRSLPAAQRSTAIVLGSKHALFSQRPKTRYLAHRN
jgi:hypothetical protein